MTRNQPQQKLDLSMKHWQPKIVAQVNDYDVRIVKVKGEFVWHKHDHTDDFFLVSQRTPDDSARDRTSNLDRRRALRRSQRCRTLVRAAEKKRPFY